MTSALDRAAAARPVLLCLSHLRWDFVFQRPQHLMVRAARDWDVLFFEEPEAADAPGLRIVNDPSGVRVATPLLPPGSGPEAIRSLLDRALLPFAGRPLVTWYYTPMALPFSDHLSPWRCVYDCMDELSAFRFAPPELRVMERALFRRADMVFTGGRSLYEAKRGQHEAVFCFPSSIDAAHFGKARLGLADPADQASIPRPRIGYFGVIDERMDLDLVARTAEAAPDLSFVMIGPVAKVDPDALPRAANLHWLGRKGYAELPAYLANWQAGWMPFALNDATRFISPTKTPEFLAAGLPVCSTAVHDVVETYGKRGLVSVAAGEGMVAALRASLRPRPASARAAADRFLAKSSWDETWSRMSELIVAGGAPATVTTGSAGAKRAASLPSFGRAV